MSNRSTTARKKQRLKGLREAARACGVTEHHLRLVVHGERTSPGLLAKWGTFTRERARFLARVGQLVQ